MFGPQFPAIRLDLENALPSMPVSVIRAMSDGALLEDIVLKEAASCKTIAATRFLPALATTVERNLSSKSPTVARAKILSSLSLLVAKVVLGKRGAPLKFDDSDDQDEEEEEEQEDDEEEEDDEEDDDADEEEDANEEEDDQLSDWESEELYNDEDFSNTKQFTIGTFRDCIDRRVKSFRKNFKFMTAGE